MMCKLTYEIAKSLFSYNQLTGVLTYLIDAPPRGKCGMPAGSISHTGYLYVSYKGKLHKAHRIIWLLMTGALPQNDLDHIDGNKLNNSWINLREATRSQNLMNQGKKFNNTSGYKGVIARGNSYGVCFRVGGKNLWIGSYPTALEAAHVYDTEVVKYQGQFAKTNKALGLL